MALTAANITFAALVGSAVGLSAFFMIGGPPKSSDSVQNDDADNVLTVSHTNQDPPEIPIPIKRNPQSLIEQYQNPPGMTHQSFTKSYEDSDEYPRVPPPKPSIGNDYWEIGGKSKSKRRSRKHKRRRRTSSSSKHR